MSQVKRVWETLEDEREPGMCKYCGEALLLHAEPLCLWAKEALGIEPDTFPCCGSATFGEHVDACNGRTTEEVLSAFRERYNV
jgi:hypothetical protein